MALTCSSLVDQTRRFLRDWPDLDASTASITSSATTLAVADSAIYQTGWPVEQDQEVMLVRAKPTATTLTVRRGAYGTTGASHASGASILVRPDFYALEIIDALNAGILAAYPLVHQKIVDESLTTLDNTFEYTVPNMSGSYDSSTVQIPRVTKVSVKVAGDYVYRAVKRWEIVPGSTRKIKLRLSDVAGGTIRVEGYGPVPPLASITDTLSSAWPASGNRLLPIYAASSLLMSGESRRVRVDTGAIDAREQATRTGASMQAAMSLYNRWLRELANLGVPPPGAHREGGL